METAADPALVRDLADYTRPLRRRWRWVAIGVASGLVLGLTAAGVTHRDYTSTAAVVVTPTGVQQQDVNNANGRTQDVINLDTEAQIVRSDAVASRVRRALHAHASLATIERRVTVTVPANTTIMRISYTAGSPRHAAAGAQAFATSYLAARASTAARLLQSEEAAISKQIASVADELTGRNARSSGATAHERSVRALRYKALAAESTALATQLSTLSTTVVTPGTVIAGATTPSGGSGRSFLFLLSGAMLGLLLGASGAVAYDRIDTRLREPRDLEDAGIRVVGAIDTPSNAMRTYRRVRNTIIGTSPGRSGIVLVARPTWEPRDNDVALNVATAIRDVAGSVALVSVEEGGTDITHLDGRGGVTPSDLAAESAEFSAALAAATRGDLRQSVEQLKESAGFVVVDAADPLAEAVLPACDTALLVVSMKATRVPDVVDAAHEMEHLGVRVLGAVVAPSGARTAFAPRSWVAEWRRMRDERRGSETRPAPEHTSSQV